MVTRLAHPFTAVILIAGLSAQASGMDWEDLQGPYLGQDPPGAVPEIFAPGIVSTEDVIRVRPGLRRWRVSVSPV